MELGALDGSRWGEGFAVYSLAPDGERGIQKKRPRGFRHAAFIVRVQLLRRRVGRGFQSRDCRRAFRLDRLVALAGDAPDARNGAARACRDEPADNDVLLETFERIHLAVDGGIGEHACGLLERRRREHGARLQGGFGDAEQDRPAFRRLAVHLDRLRVGLLELGQIDLLAGKQSGVAAILDFHLLEHLADDDLDVLVVDLHALQAIDLLDLVDEIDGKLLHALDAQDVMRRRMALDDEVALFHIIALTHADVLGFGQQIFDRLLLLVLGLQDDAALVLVVLAELDIAVGFRQPPAVLGLARVEEFRDARQTAGDVAGLGAFRRNTRQHVARFDLGAVFHRKDRVHRQRIARFTGGKRNRLALLVDDRDRRAQVRAFRRAGAPIDDLLLAHARGLVRHFRQRKAFGDVVVADDAVDFGQDRQGVRIPLGDPLATLDVLTLVHEQARTIGDAMRGALRSPDVGDGDLHVAAHGPELALVIAHHVAVDDLHLAVMRGFDLRLRRHLRRTTDMEGAHGELGARFADRLRRDDANGFADIHRGAAGKIAPIAFAADAIQQLATQHRAYAHLLNMRGLDSLCTVFGDLAAAFDDDLAGFRMLDVFGRGAAEDALGKRSHDLPAVDDGLHADAFLGAAVFRGDNAVIRHVDQAPGQITRIGRLQRRVGQALAGAMRRVEIFENGEPFGEVEKDRRLDDFAGRLGHQPAHARQLLHLLLRTASAGTGHHEDGVQFHGAARFGIDPGLRDLLHHFRRHLIGTFRPGIHHEIVFLAIGRQPFEELLLELAHTMARLLDQLLLGIGNNHVVLAEGDAGLASLAEAQRHGRVAEQNGLLLPAMTIDLIDDVADLLLAQLPVDELERNQRTARQELGQHHAAGRGFHPPRDRLVVLVDGLVARLDLRMQRDRAGIERVLDLAHVVEHHALAGLVVAFEREVEQPEHDVLRRHDDRLAVGGREDVVGRHHQHARFELGFERQRHVNRHLVAVEVRIECGTDQRMELDRLALDQHRLERLNAEAMQGWGAVEQHRMFADHLFEDVPDLRLLLFDELLGLFDGRRESLRLKPRIDERLEQLQRHLLGQAALVQLQLGTHNDHRTAGIIDALAEQVLTEASLLALQHIGERFQRALVGPRDDAAAATVIK